MSQDDGIKGGKAPFEAPRLITIDLAADEVLGTSCKLGVDPPYGPDANPCQIQSCLLNGS